MFETKKAEKHLDGTLNGDHNYDEKKQEIIKLERCCKHFRQEVKQCDWRKFDETQQKQILFELFEAHSFLLFAAVNIGITSIFFDTIS